MAYHVKIDVFDGPFDLLLHLVRVHEMDIYDIPIANITRQYLDFIKQMQEMDLEVAGDFLVMAATLIQIKSRTLMPLTAEEEAEEEEEEEIDGELADIRDAQDLMRRLIEYREFKELAVKISEREEQQLRMFYRNTVLPRIEEDGADEEIREDINLLFSAFARVLQFADGQAAHHVTGEEFHVEDKIEDLDRLVEEQRRVDINSLMSRCVNKQEMLTLFLALLEVCKMGRARVWQDKNYGVIYLMHPSEMEDDEEE